MISNVILIIYLTQGKIEEGDQIISNWDRSQIGAVQKLYHAREEGGEAEGVIMKEFSYFSYGRKFRNGVRWAGAVKVQNRVI